MPTLVSPCVEVHASFVRAVEEAQAEGRHLKVDLAALRTTTGFREHLRKIAREALEDEKRPDWLVPQTTFWWVEGSEYIGWISIRHRLTDALRQVGGHVGYEIRPTRRREGHATAMLREALPFAARLGIDPALITCDDTNLASARVIEANGGVLENLVGDKRRYWVRTEPAAYADIFNGGSEAPE